MLAQFGFLFSVAIALAAGLLRMRKVNLPTPRLTHPGADMAGIARQLKIEHYYPGLPEPGR
jgi:hypothetical protein